MASILIPVTSDADSVATYSLDDVNLTFRFRYNDRAGAWFFDVSDESGNAIISGRKIVVSWPLMGWRETDTRLPGGRLFACDTTDHDLDPTEDDLGTRILLNYIEAADIADDA
jgi:hypothetical protein